MSTGAPQQSTDRGTALPEQRVRARNYERGGRGWVDLDLLLVVPDGARPIARIRHTAIHRLEKGA